ncbi:MAG: hypothetical protein AAF996_11775 [Pseudomonadota bacterium]
MAFLIAACGIYLLHAAWRARTANSLRLVGGWGLLCGATILWAMTSGADKGTALGITVVIAAVLVVLVRQALSADEREPRPLSARTAEPETLTGLTIVRRIWVSLLIGPIGGIAALTVCVAGFAIFKQLGVEHTINLTVVSLAFPFVWAGLAVFSGFEPRLLRKSAAVIGTGLLPFTYLLSAG